MFGKQCSVNSVRHRCAQYVPVPLQAACRHAAKCEMLGDKFTQWNPLTERLEYLHIQQSMLDVFTRKWAMISTSKVVGKASGQKQGEQENGKQKEGEQENGEQKEGEQENGKHKKDEQENDQEGRERVASSHPTPWT